VIASQFCLCDTETVFILKLGYDESFAHVGPGNSLFEQLVRWCYASPNLHEINLAGRTRWFQEWHPEPNNVYRVHLFNHTPIGQIHRIKCAAQARLRLLAWAQHGRAQNKERGAAASRGRNASE
jgi:hypothetical protein